MLYRMSIFLLLGLASCKNAGSDIKIDDGIMVDGTSVNKISAVYNVLIKFGGSAGGCTGTAVSTDTFVFAAHCVEQAGYGQTQGNVTASKAEVCVSNVLLQNVCTTKVYVPRQYAQNDPKKMAYDVAIAVYPSGTFKTFAEVRADAPSIGEPVLLVGYSEEQLPQGASGSKRWGQNKIEGKLSGITLVSTARGSSSAVGVSPGDSGGPMFDTKCRVIGVASRMQLGGQKQNLHTNLGWPDNNAWMKSLSPLGASICGLGATAATCPGDGRFTFKAGAADVFPCTESGPGANPTPNPGQDPAPTTKVEGINLAESDDRDLKVFFTIASGQQVKLDALIVCAVKDPENAAAVADCTIKSGGVTKVKTESGLDFFQTSINVSSIVKDTGLVVIYEGKVIGRVMIERK